LVGGNLRPLAVRAGSGYRTIPTSLALFRIGGDGRLTFVRKDDVATSGATQVWTGMIALP